jgi:hypothetical protein
MNILSADVSGQGCRSDFTRASPAVFALPRTADKQDVCCSLSASGGDFLVQAVRAAHRPEHNDATRTGFHLTRFQNWQCRKDTNVPKEQ